MTEVENCGGGHHTWLRNQLVCLWGAPSPIYKDVEEGAAGLMGCAPRGEPTPSRSRIPPFLDLLGGGRKERGRERERGVAPPSPSPIWTPLGGATSSLLSSLSPKAH